MNLINTPGTLEICLKNTDMQYMKMSGSILGGCMK